MTQIAVIIKVRIIIKIMLVIIAIKICSGSWSEELAIGAIS